MNPNGNVMNLRPFKPGQSGNPGGKPAAARNRLQGAFVDALCADWEVNGKKAIERCREESPSRYLAVVAGIVCKGIQPTDNSLNSWDRVSLRQMIEHLQEAIRVQGLAETLD